MINRGESEEVTSISEAGSVKESNRESIDNKITHLVRLLLPLHEAVIFCKVYLHIEWI